MHLLLTGLASSPRAALSNVTDSGLPALCLSAAKDTLQACCKGEAATWPLHVGPCYHVAGWRVNVGAYFARASLPDCRGHCLPTPDNHQGPHAA